MPLEFSVSFSDHALVAASLAAGLVQYAEQRGVEIDRLLDICGLDPATFKDTTARISFDRLGYLFELLSLETNDPAFTLKYADAYRLGDTGPLGFAMLNAPDLRTMWTLFARVTELVVDATYYSVREEGDLVINEWSYSPTVTRFAPFSDMGTAIFVRHIRNFTGKDWEPIQIDFQRPKPKGDLAPFHAAFGSVVNFGMRHNRCIFPRKDFDCRLQNADERVYEIMSQVCLDAWNALNTRHDVMVRARNVITYLLQTGRADLANVAHQMAMSERSLQRRLAERNTSFGTLIDEARRALSDILLSNDDLSLNEIAHRCGYGSSAAYSRAVSGWHGKPPGSLRRTLATKTE